MSRSSILLSVTCLCMAAVSAADREDGYAVIYDGAVAMKKMPIEHGNLYPWLDPSEIYIHSCGLARITYKEVDKVAFLAGDYNFSTKNSSFYYLMGEWCEVADALMETSHRAAHVISYRKWDGKKYLLSRADVFTDNDGNAYVTDNRFIEMNELQALVRPISQGEGSSGCIDEKHAHTEMHADSADLATGGDLRCVTRGVQLKDFVLRANKSLERTRER